METLQFLGSISNYLGFWGAWLAAVAAIYFFIQLIEWLSAKLFGL